jgi:hypothetical protein
MSNDDHNPIYGDPFQALLDHFEAADIRYSSNREERRVWFSMNSGGVLQNCSFKFDKTGDVLQICIQYPVLATEKFRPLAMEFLTRANYGLVLGSFDFDNSDGEAKFRVSYLMTDGRLEGETIRRLFSTAMGTANRYFGPYMKVLFAGETPTDAIFLAELDQHAEAVEDAPKNAPAQPKTSKRPRRKNAKAKSSKGVSRDPSDESAQSTQESVGKTHVPTSSTPPPTPSASCPDNATSEDDFDGETRKAA